MKIGITERGDAARNIHQALNGARQCDGAIFITKAPDLMYEHLSLHKFDIGVPYIVHCTITGMGGTIIEPHVDNAAFQLHFYHQLIGELGPERCVLRVDPVVPTDKGIETALSVVKEAEGRVRTSFLDLYDHVRLRFMGAGVPDNMWNGLHAPFHMRRKAYDAINTVALSRYGEVEVCGEPDFRCTGCVSLRDLTAMGIEPDKVVISKGQRSACTCIAAKHELLTQRGQCGHGCLYCYWK
jgi:hypothetical protein